MFTAAICGTFAVPLASLFIHANVSIWLQALIVALTVLSVVRPIAGVVALAVLLPLSLALESLIGPPPAAGITEALMMAFAIGAAPRLALPAPGVRDRLGRPALIFSLIVCVACFIELVSQQAASPARSVASEAWRHLTRNYLFVPRPFADLHHGFRWLEVMAVCVFAERAIRRSPTAAPIAVRMFLVGGAAAASFAVLRLTTILIEGRLSQDRLEILAYVIRRLRITALHADPNAAGSYFALLLVPAIIIGIRRRSIWLLGLVCPLVGLSFLLASSRAGMVGVGVILGAIALIALVRARRFGTAAAGVLLFVGAAFGAGMLTDPSHAPLDRATAIRAAMARVSLEMARDYPMFGVGPGLYVPIGRQYIRAGYPALARWAPDGENSHNNFLQILAEYGVLSLLAFVWLVVPAARRWNWLPTAVPDTALYAHAMTAGVAAFLVTAVFGHPLLITQVAAAFFLALGLSAGLMPSPSGAGHIGRIVTYGVIAFLAVSLPWRLIEARAQPGDVEGIGPAAGTLDGMAYHVASGDATWRLDRRTDGVTLWLRWDASQATDCDVDVFLDGHQANRARPDTAAWMPLRFPVPPARSPVAMREVSLRVSDSRCRLLVGPIEVQD
jgi:O-antigen ligase